jgi:DNA anti-recombination protein RmuC
VRSEDTIKAKLISSLQDALNQALTQEESMKAEVRRIARNHMQEKAALTAKIAILQAMSGMDDDGDENNQTLDAGGSAQAKLISALETRLNTSRQERDHAMAETAKLLEELSEFRGTSSEVKKLRQQAKFNELAWSQEKGHQIAEIKELKAKVKVMEAALGELGTVYGVWGMVYGLWDMVYGIWCMVYGV